MNRRLLSGTCLLIAISAQGWGQANLAVLESLKFREIGPYRGGRSNAASGVPGRPNEFYGGFTGGGVWKSLDAGETWKCVSDGFFKAGSVGAIAVHPKFPDVVYVGMGETQVRGNISPGDGVYRSDDAGKTWRHLGLESTRFISRIRVHPTDPDTAWVAALGHIYGPHNDRGIYKTTDGGESWKKTLFVDERSGACDLSVDPFDPLTLYATTWTVWRTPYSLNSGGPGSKVWKSTDGGETWKPIEMGLGLLGKVGISASAAKKDLLYAMVESAKGGLYRSDDGGATWAIQNQSSDLRQRPWYYTRVYADPKDAESVYVLNVAYHKSTDGGKRFSSSISQHSDNHDMWIDPTDTKRMIMANDGGVTVSIDGGRTWSAQDIPTAQFYHVSTDNSYPYRILGAQQDNSTVRIASRTNKAGIGAGDWTSTAGGESGYVVAKPDDADIVMGGSYGGNLEVLNHRTNQSRSVDPWPDNPMGAGAGSVAQRFQWTFPIVFSRHDPKIVYTCSQYVLRSSDLGGSWTRISPDLTKNDPSKQGSSGGPITQDNTSVEYYNTVFTLAESPLKKGLLWAGSDCGLVHVTSNGGRTWKNVTPKEMPTDGLCSMIEASPHDPATAFLAVDNHENDDHRPYVYVTRDGGKSWRNAANGLPSDHYVRVVREDLTQPGLLYAGTEFGLFVSFDYGNAWQSLQMNLPIVPIHDLTIKEDDLVIATHGRSFWVLDDLSLVRGSFKASSRSVVLFKPRPGTPGGWGPASSPENPGMNPVGGNLAVNFWLPAEVASVSVEMLDTEGTVVASMSPKGTKGLNRVNLTPRYSSWQGFPGLRFWAAGPSPIKAPPGNYLVRLKVDGKTYETQATWRKDPRSPASDKDLLEQYRFSKQIAAEVNLANSSVVKIRAIRTKLEALFVRDPDLKADVALAIRNLTEVEEALYQTKAQASQDLLNYPIRLNNKLAALMGNVQSGNFGPTKQSYEVFKILKKELDVVLNKLDLTVKNDIGKLNKELEKRGKPALVWEK